MPNLESLSVTLASRDGISIATSFLGTSPAVGTVILCHGVCEHYGRYGRFFQALRNANFCCIGFDLRGHGTSGGARGHVERFDDYLADLGAVVQLTWDLKQTRDLGQSTFLMGHSMGGVIAARYLQGPGKSQAFDGLLLSSPGFELAIEIPWYKRAVASLLAPVVPSIRLPTGIGSSAITSDATEEHAYASDPLVQSRVSLRWYTEFEVARHQAMADASKLTLPTYAFCGSDDAVVQASAVKRFVQETSSKDSQFRLWEGLRHETLNEGLPARDAVTAQIVAWLRDHSDCS